VAALTMLMIVASSGPLVVRSLDRAAASFAAGRLAFTNLVRSAGRTGVMVAALGAAVATAFVTAGFSKGVTESITSGVFTNMDGVQVSSVSAGANVNVDAGISPDALAALADVPGVEDIHRSTVVLAGSRAGEVMLVTAYEDPWYMRDGTRGVRGRLDPEGIRRGEVLVSTDLARTTGLRPGDMLALPTPSGMVEVPIQAVVYGAGTGDGRVWMSFDKHVELYGAQPSRAVYVEAKPGVSPGQLAGQIRAADLGAEVRVETPVEVVADTEASVADQMVPFWTLQRGLLAVSFVAVLSTMLLVGVQRRREMATLAAVGSSPSTLARMVLTEAAVVAFVAMALGALAGAVLLWAMTELAPLMMGFPVSYRPNWLPTLSAGGMALASALLGALWPARRAAHTEVLPALRSE
jgi:putative ABC transport system permease protein